MQDQIYRFRVIRSLGDGWYEAKDDVDQSSVTLFESVPESSSREAVRQKLLATADRLGCETFSTTTSEYIVATSEGQKSSLIARLEQDHLLTATRRQSESQTIVSRDGIATKDSIWRPRSLWVSALALLLIGVATAIYIDNSAVQAPVLRLEGSTTIGDELATKLIVAFLNEKHATEVQALSPVASGKDVHHDVRARLPGSFFPATFSVLANGSPNAFIALGAHRADIGMSSRPIKENEAENLRSEGDMRSSCCENVLALDGIAVIVNPQNPVTELSKQQIASIFRGSTVNWEQVGGIPGPIHLVGRDPKSPSGTLDTFVNLVMGDKPFANSLMIKLNGEEIAKAVSADPNGIGYVAIAQVQSAKAIQVSDGPGTSSLLPSSFTVATEDYPLHRRLYLYTTTQQTSLVKEFVDFALSPAGQMIVESTGFITRTPFFERPPIPEKAPAAYTRRIQGLRRMSINFRFRSNLSTLDSKALSDIPLVQEALSKNHARSGVQILGFADSHGSPQGNQKLSEDRAKIIAERLKPYGIDAQFAGFSSALPVADNATSEGQEKNRRVEIWSP